MRRLTSCLAVACGFAWIVAAPRPLAAAETAGEKVTVLAGEQTHVVERALIDSGQLLIPVDDVERVSGFSVKPQGLCLADVCIPIPPDAQWLSERGGTRYFNLTRFAEKVDQSVAVDEAEHVWSFGPVPQVHAAAVASGQAPEIALTDREGKTVRLSDFRGKKVLLWTWASWCACRFDLAGWQKLYEELKDKNFEIVAAAQDTGGMAVSGPFYDKARVTFTALVDPRHTVSSLYQMVNVPTGVWIDEKGTIVRAPEVAYSKQQQILGQKIGDNRYAAGVRDWVEKGPSSPYVVAADKVRAKLAPRDPQLRLADAQFKLGTYFFEQGNKPLATRHWQMAQQLNPDSWNYHRQDWSFDKAKEMPNWFSKVQKLGGKPYYEPVEFPAP